MSQPKFTKSQREVADIARRLGVERVKLIPRGKLRRCADSADIRGISERQKGGKEYKSVVAQKTRKEGSVSNMYFDVLEELKRMVRCSEHGAELGDAIGNAAMKHCTELAKMVIAKAEAEDAPSKQDALAAAAPDLLSACKAFVVALNREDYTRGMADIDAAGRMAEAAIAKAEGRG